MAEILASLEDINAHLADQIITADDTNTDLIQISVSRVVRGYLAKVVDSSILGTWINPGATPDIIREIAGMLVASQLFFDKTVLTTVELDQRHYAQILYDRAMGMLAGIVAGTIDLPISVIIEPVETMSTLDFFPIDDTDRAFSMKMEL